MNRIYHHYQNLEEYHAGLWRNVHGDEKKKFVILSRDILRSEKYFSLALDGVITKWKNSCEHNLTAFESNRIAWMGQAGCCFSTNSPESCTRIAWYLLTEREQNKANEIAAKYIEKWELSNISQGWIQADMFEEMMYA